MTPTRISIRSLPLLISIVYFFAGADPLSGQDFQSLSVPQPNRVLHPVALPNPAAVALTPLPPSAHALAVRVLQDGHLVRGSDTIPGSITSIVGNLISYHPAAGSDLTIGFALPASMSLKNRHGVSAVLTVNDASTPLAADKDIRISEGNNLYAIYIWQSSRTQIYKSLPDSVGTIQQQINGLVMLHPVQGLPFPMRSGDIKTFTNSGKKYIIFVQTALHQVPSFRREGDGSPRGYVLKAIVMTDQ